MELALKTTITVKPVFLEVSAGVRYWEDASVDGAEDTEGKIPLRNGENWEPVIDLRMGVVKAWPSGVTANVHYKVCDQGDYWLQDEDGKRIAKWSGDYVPNDLLCIGDNGFGDYIILKIGTDGTIEGWKQPSLDADQWVAL